jgi:hypothetical protein
MGLRKRPAVADINSVIGGKAPKLGKVRTEGIMY